MCHTHTHILIHKRTVSEKMNYDECFIRIASVFPGYAKVMSLWIHVRGANGQRNDRQDRGMPRGSDSRSIRDPAIQEDQ